MLSVPLERRAGAMSAYDHIEDHLRSSGKRRPLVVHRIDLDTSGLVIFAKKTLAQEQLKAQFRRREPERVDWAVVYGHPNRRTGVWSDTLVWDQKALIQKETHPNDPRGMEAMSHYRVLERFRDTSLIEVRLHTGKRNQIRIQARLRGHTFVGERRYVFGPDALRPIAFARQALHAYRLVRPPGDGRPLIFEAPLPEDFTDLLRGCDATDDPADEARFDWPFTDGTPVRARARDAATSQAEPGWFEAQPRSRHRVTSSYPRSRRTHMLRYRTGCW